MSNLTAAAENAKYAASYAARSAFAAARAAGIAACHAARAADAADRAAYWAATEEKDDE